MRALSTITTAFFRFANGIFVFVFLTVAQAGFAQPMEAANEGWKMSSNPKVIYLALSSFVVWIVVFLIVFTVYRSQKQLAQRIQRLEESKDN